MAAQLFPSLFAKLPERVFPLDCSHFTCHLSCSLALYFSLLKQTNSKPSDDPLVARSDASSESALQHLTVLDRFLLYTFLGFAAHALLSVPSRSPWLAPLLLTSENRCPQLLLTPYFSCLCNSIYSQGFICYAWGWPSNLHLQAILLTYTPNLYF